jgi:hypothetical protein
MILALRPGSEKTSAVRRKGSPDSVTPIEMGRADRLKD